MKTFAVHIVLQHAFSMGGFMKNSTKISFLGVLLVLGFALPSRADATCFIFVHGHSSSPLYPSYTDARNYWKNGSSSDMAGYIGANNKFVIINYNTGVAYW